MVDVTPRIHEDVDERQQTAQEPPYRVIIHNDDVTPMEFVLDVLRQIFLLAGARAVQVMYTAHFHGSAYVATLPRLEALRRVHQAHFTARMQGYPLQFSVEKE